MRKPILALLALGLLVWPTPSSAQAPAQLDFSPQSKVWFEGDSTLHPYQVTAKQWDSKAVVTDCKADGAKLSAISVVIPVKALKSKEKALDDNMYKALQADKYPTIRFSAGQARVSLKGGVAELEADGRLAIAGTEKPVTVRATGKLVGSTLQLKGSQAILMSDFGVKPPVLLGGMIKCSDKIVVHYDLVGLVKD